MEVFNDEVKLKQDPGNILELCDIQYQASETINSFYIKCRSLISNILRKKGDRFGDVEVLEDEILSPTFEELIILWCLEKIDSNITKNVRQAFGDRILHGSTLSGLSEEIFQYLSTNGFTKNKSNGTHDEYDSSSKVKDEKNPPISENQPKSENCEVLVTELKTELDDLNPAEHLIDDLDDGEWEEDFDNESDNSGFDSDFEIKESAKRRKKSEDDLDDKEKQTCPICNKVLASIKTLNNHMQKHANNKKPKIKNEENKTKNLGNVICDECGKALSSKRRLAEHIKNKHNKAKIYSCNDCDKQFKNAAGLRAHNEELHKQKKGPEMCPECGKMVHFSSLKRHRLIHLTNIRCDMCGARCLNQEALDTHKLKHEKDPEYCKKRERTIQCDTCNRKFFDVVEYGSHVCKHFACDACDAKFVMERNLRKHKKFHAGENIFSCDLCESLYTKRKELLRHMRYAHDPAQRKYKCDECGKAYLNKTSLNTHKAIHTTVKSFKCELCGKGFHQKASLHIHMKSHTGEKPFPCLECDMMFRSLTEMKKHRESNKCAGFKTEDVAKSEI